MKRKPSRGAQARRVAVSILWWARWAAATGKVIAALVRMLTQT